MNHSLDSMTHEVKLKIHVNQGVTEHVHNLNNNVTSIFLWLIV